MHGTAYTVFEGSKPEPMQVEVLGILRNMTGPKGDVILVRLHGTKPEYTGVVAGMSGSPVYIDGKLVGALAFRIGQFSKEPIAGITPISSMLEINELDSAAAQPAPSSGPSPVVPARTGGPGEAPPIASVAQYLQPIDTPLVFNGFNQETIQRFSSQFAAAGIVPVMGAGSADPSIKDPVPIEAGSSVAAVLVRGDMDISATCTVTYMDANRLLACGHPLDGKRGGRAADDQVAGSGHAALAVQLLQDRHRDGDHRRFRPGSSQRNHGTLRQRGANDSGYAQYHGHGASAHLSL